MKKNAIILACISLLLVQPLLDARGGGGRGGGGGGRGGGMSRGPSMSRSGGGRTAAPNRNIDRSQINNRVNQTPRNVQDFSRGQGNKQALDNAMKNRSAKDLNRNTIGDNVRHDVGDRFPNRDDWFNNNFWDRHDYHPNYNFGDGNGWRWATWGVVAAWANWGWNDPYYYDYGSYDDGSYVYADQVQQTTTQTPPSGQWLSLGVFSISKEGASDVTPNIYMQLALDKSGNIGGTIYNTTSDQVYPLQGTVDKETQRAAWTMSNSENAPVLQTGIYNLTQDQAPASIVYADGTTQNVILVRLKQ